jgi:endonuclease G
MKSVAERLAKAVDEIQRRDRTLASELRDVREKARMRPAPFELPPLGDVELEGPERHQFVAETIVLRTGRPVLAIRRDEAVLEFSAEDSSIWKQRLTDAERLLVPAIRAVGRVEVQFHPTYEWIGTGWLVAPDIVVTNRHVAYEFGRRSDQRFVFRQGVGDQRMQASIDFLEEFDRAESREFTFERILHIEDEDGPDIAFAQVRRRNGDPLAAPIELAATAAEDDEYIAVIGYPARDGRIPEQALMRQIFGDQYNKKRLAPGQVTRTQNGAVLHDCSTLGGNSGSVVLSLQSGKALGLHFAGRFLEANYAVPARIVAQRLDEVSRGESPRRAPARRDTGATQPVSTQATVRGPATPASGRGATWTIPVRVTIDVGTPQPARDHDDATKTARRLLVTNADADEDVLETEARPEDYADRPGYAEDFIGDGISVPLPRITRGQSDVLSFQLDGERQQVLKYQHFSVLMSRSRRLCRYSAVNVNGTMSRKAKRPG